MALVVKDRVQETSTTTGTGTFTLAGAVSGFQSFSVIGNANTTYYAIVGGTQWEVGLGTYTSSGTTLSRDTVLASSTGSKIDFAAGTKNVFVTYPADKSIYDDAAGNVIALGTPASVTLTNGTGLPLTTGVTGTLPIANGGTNLTTYAQGDIVYASATNTLGKLADVATGNALISGGVGADPSWGKVGLTTHVSGTLPVANGGTGITSLGTGVATFLGTPSSSNLASAVTDETGSGSLVFATSPTLVTPVLGTPSSGTLTSCTGLPLTTGVTGTLPVTNGGTGTATSFTTGSVVFAGSSGVYSQSNANFFWDNTNNRLGIGTTSPSQKLDVNGTILAGRNGSSSGYIGLLGSGDTSNSGYIAYYNSAGTRLGYTGYLGTVNAFLNLETDSSSYGVRLSANNGAALAVLRTNGQFVAGSQTFTNGTRLLAYDASGTSSTLGGFYAASTSYATGVHVSWCDRSSSSAYSFFVTRNAADTNTAHSLRGDGNAYADGTWNNNGADYAEYFESATGQAIEVGTTVVLDENKVRAATSSDDVQNIVGVVRPKEPGIASMTIGNTAWNKWSKQYITDDFGRYTLENHEVIEWEEVTTDEDGKTETTYKSYESHMIPNDVVIPENAIRKTKDEKGNIFNHYKLNPDFDSTKEYIPREERTEWLIIGLVGQVPILNNQPINNRWIKMRNISVNVSEYLIR